MRESAIRYILMLIPVVIGGSNIGSAIRCFKEGKYFIGGIDSMMAMWMICLFIDVFFEL